MGDTARVRAAKWGLYRRQVCEAFVAAFGEHYGFRRVLFSIVTALAAVLVLAGIAGVSAAIDQLKEVEAAIYSVVLCLPLAGLIFGIGALCDAKRRVHDLGSWSGGTFIYNNPPRVYATLVKDADHGRDFPFKVPGIPHDALVRWTVEFQPANPYWIASVGRNAAGGGPEKRVDHIRAPTGATRLKDGQAYLHMTARRAQLDDVIVRVVIQSWSVD